MALRRIVLALVVCAFVAAACAEDDASEGITVRDPIGAPDTSSDYGVDSNEVSSSESDPSVIKNATIDAEIARNALSSAAQSVIDIATKADGFLVSSVVDVTGDYGSAEVVVKVPAPRFEEVVGDLGSIGDLKRQVLEGSDLTPATLGTRSDLQRARLHAASLQARLEETEDQERRLQLRQELATTRSQLRGLQEQQADIDAQTAFSTIDVALTGTAPPAPAQKPAFDRAFATAKKISLAIASAVVLAAGVLVPFAVLLLILYPLWTRLIRRVKPRLQT